MSGGRLEETHHSCEPGESHPELWSALLTHDHAFWRRHQPSKKGLSKTGAARRSRLAPSLFTCWLWSGRYLASTNETEDFCLVIFNSLQTEK